jgi:hypothetical protein
MNRRTRWYNWPAHPSNNLLPWYVIARRLLFFPLLLAGLVITTVGVLLGFGLSDARQFWRDNT